MRKSLRFLSRFYGQILLTILAFGAIVLAGLLLSGQEDGIFVMYYRRFPMMGVMIVAVTMFGAMQIGLAALVLAVPVVSKLLWELGRVLTGSDFSLSLTQLALMAAGTLMLGELSILATTLEGKLSRAVYVVAFVLYILACGILGAVTAMMEDRTGLGERAAALFSSRVLGTMLAVSLAAAVVLAALNFARMKKAVVRV